MNRWVLLVEQADWVREVKPVELPVSMQSLLLAFCRVTTEPAAGRAALADGAMVETNCSNNRSSAPK